jgi:hypothetical protein
MIRLLYFITLFLATFFAPWWFWAVGLIVSLFLFDWYWPAVISAFIFDSVYGLPGASWMRTQFVWTVTVLGLLLLVTVIKQRLIYYR